MPYAAFGLLWERLGAGILGEELAQTFDEAFVQPLDNNDNTGEKNELATLDVYKRQAQSSFRRFRS